MFTILMVEGGKAGRSGDISGARVEDIAAALDMDDDAVGAILDAMQGRVVDGGRLLNWRRYIEPSRPPASQWMAIRSRIFQRDNFTCAYCGERGGKLECDHVVPVARGGEHTDDNLVTACFSCNRTKRDRTPQEMGWRQ
ncbi:HNH endonuclease [Xanthobacter autotrophicus]|uniref:HNH endonuclease n=1 Tax=Xanthobacter autotrophicus TaxID=280 RepID=UPI00372BDB37